MVSSGGGDSIGLISRTGRILVVIARSILRSEMDVLIYGSGAREEVAGKSHVVHLIRLLKRAKVLISKLICFVYI